MDAGLRSVNEADAEGGREIGLSVETHDPQFWKGCAPLLDLGEAAAWCLWPQWRRGMEMPCGMIGGCQPE